MPRCRDFSSRTALGRAGDDVLSLGATGAIAESRKGDATEGRNLWRGRRCDFENRLERRDLVLTPCPSLSATANCRSGSVLTGKATADTTLGRSRPSWSGGMSIPVARWFFGSGAFLQIDPGQLKAGWNTLCGLQDDWRWEQHPARECDEWSPFVRCVERGNFRFLALSGQAALAYRRYQGGPQRAGFPSHPQGGRGLESL